MNDYILTESKKPIKQEYINLDTVKKHLNIDSDFTDDDQYIIALVQVAEDAISKHLDIALDDLVEDGDLPSSIKHSILLLVGNLYANREPVSYSTVMKVPYTLEYLLGLYKHYNIP